MKTLFSITVATSVAALSFFSFFKKDTETPKAAFMTNIAKKNKAAKTVVTTQQIIDLANAFKATLSSSQIATLELAYTYANAKTWSNLPAAMSPRIGLKMGTLTTAQLTAARNLIQALSGTGNEGYNEIYGLWMADNYLSNNGGGTTYGEGNFYIGFFGTPSLSGTFEIQMTGHHRTVSNTYINGILVGATPSFVAAEPFASFTYNSATYQPMIEEKTALVNMLSGLSSAQLTTAQLSTTYTDLVCGPGKDWLFPTTKSGLKVSNLTTAQKQLVYNAIATYVNDVDDTNAATIMAKYNNELDNTYIAWSTDATLTNQNGYVRIDGPSVWIEYSVQNGIILTPKHPHSIWRDHTTDYGGTGNTLSTDETNTSISKPMIYPNPVKDFATFNFTASEKGNTKINIYDQSARLVKSIEKNNLPKGQNSVSADLSSLEKGVYTFNIQHNGTKTSGQKLIKK